MPISSFLGLETALRGLSADQEAIDTTSHNIANANTPGYTRQRVNLTESPSLTIPAMSNVTGAGVQLGTGVDATSIDRIRNQFLDIQYRAQNVGGSAASTDQTVLDQVQAALAEPSGSGISTLLQNFWSAWSDLANAPQSLAAKQAVVDAGATLSDAFNTISQQLGTIQSQTQQQFAALTSPTGQVQQNATQIASLNQAIAAAQAAGQNPNDLMDQRDQLLDDLSGLAKISVSTQPNGMVNVGFGDAAAPLINGTTINWPQTLTSAAGGQLGSLLSLSQPGGQIAQFSASLDGIANQIVTAVNGISTNPPFFSGNSASTIAVSATAATLQTTATGVPGANDVALGIAGLAGGAPDQSYAAFVAQIGSEDQAASNAQKTQSALTAAIQNQRQSTNGVSLDEEMTNLITFQRGYQASARVMTTVDSMLDTLINHTGTVGL
jgi:flagellar hook-associated protein 1 FlgK